MCDKKKSDLITVPVRVTNLVDTQEIDVKFPAPRKTGVYMYTMCLKSDSYIDMDLYQNLKVCGPLVNMQCHKIIETGESIWISLCVIERILTHILL